MSYDTYIGKLGYTLIKSELTNEELKKIKTDLTVKPFVPKCIQIASEPLKFIENQQTKYIYRDFMELNILEILKTIKF